MRKSRIVAGLSEKARQVIGTAAIALGVLAAGGMMGMAPEPDPVPRRWQLDVTPGALRMAVVDVEGTGPRVYFYMTYKVTNSSGGDLLLAPAFELATDEGEVLRSGRDVPAAVTRRISSDLENPFLQDQNSIVGLILQGEENSREGLAIWPANDLDVDELTVYAAGFSGETAPVEFKDAKTGAASKVLLRKSLMLRYTSPGQLQIGSSEPLEMVEKLWVMR
ncbi:MAG: hypothetical protein ACOYN0_11165 [Phycisphaerales bacterium]